MSSHQESLIPTAATSPRYQQPLARQWSHKLTQCNAFKITEWAKCQTSKCCPFTSTVIHVVICTDRNVYTESHSSITTTNEQKPAFYLHFHICARSLPALYLQNRNDSIWSFQKWQTDLKGRMIQQSTCRDWECCCVTLGEGADEHHSSTQSRRCSEAQPWPFVSFPVLLLFRVSQNKLLSSLCIVLLNFPLFISHLSFLTLGFFSFHGSAAVGWRFSLL